MQDIWHLTVVTDCNELNIPPSLLSFQACRRMYGVHQEPIATSKMISCTTVSSSHNLSSDEIILYIYLRHSRTDFQLVAEYVTSCDPSLLDQGIYEEKHKKICM